MLDDWTDILVPVLVELEALLVLTLPPLDPLGVARVLRERVRQQHTVPHYAARNSGL